MQIPDLATFEQQFRRGQPDAAHKKQRRVTRKDLVARVRPTIVNFRAVGYSWEGISEYFSTLGVPISVATLKQYLRRQKRPGRR